MKRFMDEKLRQKCHDLVVAVYRASSSFPQDDIGVMTQELRDTALILECRIEEALLRRPKVRGVPSPIQAAQGKLSRLESSLIMCKGIKYIDEQTHEELMERAEEVQKGIDQFIGPRAVRARDRRWKWLLKLDKEIAAEVEKERKS